MRHFNALKHVVVIYNILLQQQAAGLESQLQKICTVHLHVFVFRNVLTTYSNHFQYAGFVMDTGCVLCEV
jgi:hypothetical protein